MMTCSLNEFRLLGSAEFDSQSLLTIVLCGDMRLPERFRSNALVSLGNRIRFRWQLEPYSAAELREYLTFTLEQAGAPHLMSTALLDTLAEHAAGNLRLLNTMAAELLMMGA